MQIQESDKSASVKVNADQLSLAIGKGGQNVRLAAHLTGWKINIREMESGEIKEVAEPTEAKGEVEEAKEIIEEAQEVPVTEETKTE